MNLKTPSWSCRWVHRSRGSAAAGGSDGITVTVRGSPDISKTARRPQSIGVQLPRKIIIATRPPTLSKRTTRSIFLFKSTDNIPHAAGAHFPLYTRKSARRRLDMIKVHESLWGLWFLENGDFAWGGAFCLMKGNELLRSDGVWDLRTRRGGDGSTRENGANIVGF
jgi:hypothetical protein